MDEYTCELCQRTQGGFGNNGQPVVDGRVCDVCNATQVLPARLMAMRPTKRGEYIVAVKHETWWSKTIEAKDKDEAFRIAQDDWGNKEEPQLEEEGWQFDDGTFEVMDIDEKDDD
mgnify:CR=1 FL=1